MGYDTEQHIDGRQDMSQNDPAAGFEMKHSGTKQLFEYWSDLRGGRVAPYKSEVTARGIGRTLASNTFILENLADGARRFRLAGSSLQDIFGLELRGMSAQAIMQQESRARLQSLMDECLAAPAVCVFICSAEMQGGTALPIEIVLAPLRSDFDQMNRILGAAHVLDDEHLNIKSTPRRCHITDAKTFAFTGPNIFEVDAPLPGFAEAASDFDFQRTGLSSIDGGARTGERRRGHLKIVKD